MHTGKATGRKLEAKLAAKFQKMHRKLSAEKLELEKKLARINKALKPSPASPTKPKKTTPRKLGETLASKDTSPKGNKEKTVKALINLESRTSSDAYVLNIEDLDLLVRTARYFDIERKISKKVSVNNIIKNMVAGAGPILKTAAIDYETERHEPNRWPARALTQLAKAYPDGMELPFDTQNFFENKPLIHYGLNNPDYITDLIITIIKGLANRISTEELGQNSPGKYIEEASNLIEVIPVSNTGDLLRIISNLIETPIRKPEAWQRDD